MKARSCLLILIALLVAGCTGTPGATPESAPPPSTTPNLPQVEEPEILLFDMTDSQNGWGLTDTQVLRTFDGGLTWYNVTPGGVASVYYAPFFALDEQTFWLFIPDPNREANGKLYRTRDGGLSWESFAAPPSIAQLQFLEAQNGFAMADLGAAAGSQAVAIFKTTDGGATWEKVFSHQGGIDQSLPFSGQKSGLTYSDLNHAWVTGNIPMNGLIYFYGSQDGGRSWADQEIFLPESYRDFFAGSNPPAFFSASEGLLPVDLVGSFYAHIFYRTSDGGATWTMGEQAVNNGQYAMVSFQTILVWTGSPELYVSHDSGKTWQTVETNMDISGLLIDMQFVDENTGWALASPDGSQTTLYQTTDGGATWSVILP